MDSKHKKKIMHSAMKYARSGKMTPNKAGDKKAKVFNEWKAGKLHSGSKHGPIVKKHSQAVAIALSEARKKG